MFYKMINIIYFPIQILTFEVLVISGLTIVKPGPLHPPTEGEVWPIPQQQYKEFTHYTFEPWFFKFDITKHSCGILSAGVERYWHVVKNIQQSYNTAKKQIKAENITVHNLVPPDQQYQGFISELKIVLTTPCEEYPSFGMDERYSLKVAKISILESESVWGILRGLETFVQLLYESPQYNEIHINGTSIVDFPSYPHRGLLLDTSRHYISVGNILKTLDAMAVNKMNVFHWHIVDDQSFPYQSERFPELSKKGAFHSSLVYTKKNIKEIVEYARERGIRVIPEFDVPGHTRSWGNAYPSLLTKCYSKNKMVGLGPMDPVNNATLVFLKNLFEEVQTLFPDNYFHLGGDEVDMDCWSSNPQLKDYMRDNSLSVADLHALFMKKVIPLLSNGTNQIVWQEVFDENVPLSKDTIIQVWKSLPSYEMIDILLAGYRLIYSSSWYLSWLNKEWTAFYETDPRGQVGYLITNATLLANIVGGEACMWGEMVDDKNVISRVWPRASAVAEKLWNPDPEQYKAKRGIPEEVYNRMEEHTCRMIRRGIPAQPPSGPGFCIA